MCNTPRTGGQIYKKIIDNIEFIHYINIWYGEIMLDVEKDRLIQKLIVQYSHNFFDMEEYERIMEYINKIETKNEIMIIEEILNKKEMAVRNNNYKNIFLLFSKRQQKEKYLNISGSNIIVIDKLPFPKYRINVNTFWGTTEIIVPKNIRIKSKITTFFSTIQIDEVTMNTDAELPELEIVGLAKFSKIIFKRE
jgi:hypothetical protein